MNDWIDTSGTVFMERCIYENKGRNLAQMIGSDEVF